MRTTSVLLVASLFWSLSLMPLSSTPVAAATDVTLAVEMIVEQSRFQPAFFRVEPGDNVTFVVWNNDTILHTFNLEGAFASGPWIDPDPWTSPAFNATQNRTIWFYCDVLGHATRLASGSWTGMAGRLQIGEPEAPRNDTTLLLVGGGIVLAAALAVIVVVVRRRKRPQDP